MKQTKRILSLLLAAVMIAATFVMPVFADAETAVAPQSGTNEPAGGSETNTTVEGLQLSKVYDAATKQLTLEAYVTGESQTVLTTEPADIALVLDVSGSMDDNIEVANGYNDLSKLDTVYGGAEGIYTARFSVGIGEYTLRYNSEKSYWEYYKKLINEGWTEIGSNGYEITSIRTTKLNALKMAVKRFIDETNEVAPESKISIIKFAGNTTDAVGNDTYEVQTGLFSTENRNYSQIVTDLTTVSGNTGSLKSTVDSLIAAGATSADYGLAHAKTVLDKSTSDNKVVIMLTDGEPNYQNGFDSDVANSAIATSKAMKADGTLVYTIGCWEDDPEADSNMDKYMNYVSSNYPEAADLDTPGTPNEIQRYYQTAATSTGLTEIFQAISKETGGAATKTLTQTTVIKDIIGDHFMIPESGKVTVETWNCTGMTDGKYTWVKDADVTSLATVAGKSITVTGFDFSANWVGTHTANGNVTYRGQKLVIVIDIEVDPASDAWGDTVTNAAGSGLYDESGKMLQAFPTPTCHIPYFTVVHSSDNSEENIPLHSLTNGKVNFTELVASGYLYGGTFTSETFGADTAFATDPTAFAPTDKSVYYLREVSDVYLAPKNTIVWNNVGALHAFYLLSTIDDPALYSSVGFVVGSAYTEVSSVYQTVDVMKMKNNVAEHNSWLYAVNGVIQNSATLPNAVDSYIMMNEVELNKDVPTEFTPYWVTLDGILVCGTKTRTCTYDPTKTQRDLVTATDAASGAVATPYNATEPAALNAAAYYRMSTKNEITVTVVDGETRRLQLQPGDISSAVTCAGAEGKVFAGWYTDADLKTPARLTSIWDDVTLYAKYVDAGSQNVGQ